MSDDLHKIKLRQKYGAFNGGEVAGFDTKKAKELITQGIGLPAGSSFADRVMICKTVGVSPEFAGQDDGAVKQVVAEAAEVATDEEEKPEPEKHSGRRGRGRG